jgi:hypothetical protein
MVVNESEARTLGMLLAAIGLGTVAASVARLLGVPADSAVYVFLSACGSPLVLGFAVVMWVWVQGQLSANRVAELEAQAALERASVTQKGTATPRSEPAGAYMPSVQDHHWRIAFHRFIQAGDLYGFDIRTLAKKEETRVISWDEWGVMVDILTRTGVLVTKPSTRWAADWNMARWLDERDRLSLPHPDREPPDVAVTVNSQQQNAQQRANTA